MTGTPRTYEWVSDFSNVKVISDDYTLWNDEDSNIPDIVVDDSGTVHVVWYDNTDGAWGTDEEIMYSNNTGSGWSNATVISDDSNGWNTGMSNNPSIVTGSSGTIHIAWQDSSNGEWGTDTEIMYCNFTNTNGWSNATVVSDDITLWNNDSSQQPEIVIDKLGTLHIVWQESTNGDWGTDWEIMYINNTGSGWTNVSVVSDDATLWNDGTSSFPYLIVDESNNLHITWNEGTDGEWGTDYEIMYANMTGTPLPPEWLSDFTNATVISDDYNRFYTFASIPEITIIRNNVL